MIRHVRLRVNDRANLALNYPRKHKSRTEAVFLNAKRSLDETYFKTNEIKIVYTCVCVCLYVCMRVCV